MLVTVWTSDGAKHVTLPNNATIADLKDVLVEHLNYDPDQLEISHGGRFVRDEISVARFPPNTLVAEGPQYIDYHQRLRHQQQQQAAAQRQRQRQMQQNRQYVDPYATIGVPFGRPPAQYDDYDDEEEDDDTLNYTQNGIFGAPRPHGHRQPRGRPQERFQSNAEMLREQQLQRRRQEEQQRLQEEARKAQAAQQQRQARERALREKEEALKALEAKRAAIRRQEEEMRRQKEEIAKREQELQRQLEEEERRLREAAEAEESEGTEEDDELARESSVVLHPHLQRVDLDETIHRSRSKQPSPSTSGSSTPVQQHLNEVDATAAPSNANNPVVHQTINVEVTFPELEDKSHTITIPYDCLVSDVIAAIKDLEPEATQTGVRLMFCDKYVRSEKESIRSVPLMEGSKVVACTGKYLSENEMTLYMAASKLKEVRKAVAEHPERPIDRNLKMYWNELLMKALMQLDSLQEVPEDIRLRRKAAVKEVMAEQDVLIELN